jgi:hypothetical protein
MNMLPTTSGMRSLKYGTKRGILYETEEEDNRLCDEKVERSIHRYAYHLRDGFPLLVRFDFPSYALARGPL